MKQAGLHRLKPLDYSATEAINTICSNLSFAGRDMKKVVLTSSNANEGKSYLSMQIAVNVANRGKRVILVDGDLRRSIMVSHFGITSPSGPMTGLVHYLAGHNDIDDVVYQTDIDNLHLLPVGRDIANPIPLLLSPAFGGLLDFLVIVDAPPVGVVIDAAEIARNCDGIIIVAKYRSTHRRELAEARQQLLQTGTPILGCILNDVAFDSISTKRYYGKSYYHHYGYYRRDDGKKK